MSLIEEFENGTNLRRKEGRVKSSRVSTEKDASIKHDLKEKALDSKRPQSMIEIIGRAKEKEKLRVLMESAKQRGEVVDHILFYGPPGLGKTTFAHVIAKEMNVNVIFASGPAITSKAEVASLLSNISEGDILFIDEIHRLNKIIEEFLYPVMEDFKMDLSLGKGVMAKVVNIEIPKFTLIGATTQIGLLSAPFRDRFGFVLRLDFYSAEELCELIINHSNKMGIKIELEAAKIIAERSRGTARVAIKHLRRVLDYFFTNQDKASILTLKVTHDAFERMEVDEFGLDSIMRKYLQCIIENFEGGPVGITNIVASILEDSRTIEEVYEPYLIKIGFIKRTSRGRMITDKGKEYYHKHILINL